MSRQQVLLDLVTKHGLRTGAELGVFKGATLFYLLDKVPELSMIGVDDWAGNQVAKQDKNSGAAPYDPNYLDQIYHDVMARADRYGPRCRILRAKTVNAVNYVVDHSLDFVFIDADHSEDAVYADVMVWRNSIKPGGFMTGHDVNWPSVQRALRRANVTHTVYPSNVWISRI